jgi:hypothetical protein
VNFGVCTLRSTSAPVTPSGSSSSSVRGCTTAARGVAEDAEIDPSMVMRYFGSKEGLFAAALDVDLALPDLSPVPRDQVGVALAGHFVDHWEGATRS